MKKRSTHRAEYRFCSLSLSLLLTCVVILVWMLPCVVNCSIPVNSSFELLDSASVVGTRSLAIVNGISTQFDKKDKHNDSVSLSCTEKMRRKLVSKLSEKQLAGIRIASDSGLVVRLVDPFSIVSRKEAKALTGKDPKEAAFHWEPRSWAECENCQSLADSLGVDAVWVIWARWFTNEQDLSKTEYSKKDKGWLHVSAHLYSVTDGRLLAWTSINRTGIGFLFFNKWSKAYSVIANSMAKNMAKCLGAR
jgi:hypothetical protein